jgi:hypothetical protein
MRGTTTPRVHAKRALTAVCAMGSACAGIVEASAPVSAAPGDVTTVAGGGQAQMAAVTRRFVLGAVALLVVACVPTPAAPVRYRYGVATPDSFTSIGVGDRVVVGPQATDAGDRRAAQFVHDRGASAFRYVQSYWSPLARQYQGMNVNNHLDWAFCAPSPIIDTVAHPGHAWLMLDMNERAARNAAVRYLRHVKDAGYDGVFFDRGMAALIGQYSHVQSTCTTDPIVPGRTQADAYVALWGQAKAVRLQVAFNSPPFAMLPASALALRPSFVMDEGGITRLESDRQVAVGWGFTGVVLIRPERVGIVEANARAAAIVAAGLTPIRGVRWTDEQVFG